MPGPESHKPAELNSSEVEFQPVNPLLEILALALVEQAGAADLSLEAFIAKEISINTEPGKLQELLGQK